MKCDVNSRPHTYYSHTSPYSQHIILMMHHYCMMILLITLELKSNVSKIAKISRKRDQIVHQDNNMAKLMAEVCIRYTCIEHVRMPIVRICNDNNNNNNNSLDINGCTIRHSVCLSYISHVRDQHQLSIYYIGILLYVVPFKRSHPNVKKRLHFLPFGQLSHVLESKKVIHCACPQAQWPVDGDYDDDVAFVVVVVISVYLSILEHIGNVRMHIIFPTGVARLTYTGLQQAINLPLQNDDNILSYHFFFDRCCCSVL